MRQNLRGLRGVTVVEVLVAVGIFGLLVISVMAIFLNSWRYNGIVWEQLKTQNEGRRVMQDFTNDLRTASASSIGAYPVVSASATEFIFYSNIDTDTLVERIRYFMSGATLRRGLIKPAGNPFTYNPANETFVDMAHDVANTSSVFYYYNSNYSGAENPLPSPVTTTLIRMVRITLTLEEDPHLTPAPFSIETQAMIRNLKDN